MDRRTFVGTLSLGLLAAPFVAEAQQAAKIAQIGFLSLNRARNPHLHEAFRLIRTSVRECLETWQLNPRLARLLWRL
jgi:hypothetical protein